MEHGALQHALEAQRRLRFALGVAGRDQRRGRLDELVQFLAQTIDVGADCLQHVDRDGVVEQRQQQMLDRHPLMPLRTSFFERQVQRDFEIFAQHWVT